MHCDHCVRRYEHESVAVEAVCVVNLNCGHCDTATRNCATEWSLRVTATQLLKKRRHGQFVFVPFKRKINQKYFRRLILYAYKVTSDISPVNDLLATFVKQTFS